MAKIAEIKLGGKNYPMSFSLMASKKIAQKHGSVETFLNGFAETESFDEKTIESTSYILSLLIMQGCAYRNHFEKDVPVPKNAPYEDGKWKPLSQDEIEMLIQFDELEGILIKITECISGGKKKEVVAKTEGKNVKAGQE